MPYVVDNSLVLWIGNFTDDEVNKGIVRDKSGKGNHGKIYGAKFKEEAWGSWALLLRKNAYITFQNFVKNIGSEFTNSQLNN